MTISEPQLRELDVRGVIHSFGGIPRLSAKLGKIGTQISQGGIEKWRERNNIPGHYLMKLAEIAENEGWVFNLTDFRKREVAIGSK